MNTINRRPPTHHESQDEQTHLDSCDEVFEMESIEGPMLSEQIKYLQKAIVDMNKEPIINMERVCQILKKIEQEEIGLISSGEKCQEAASDLADKILRLEAELSKA